MEPNKNEYGLGDISWPSYKITGPKGQNDVSVQLRIWGGAIRIGVYNPKEFKPFFERTITDAQMVLLIELLNNLKTMSPGTKQSIQVSKYNPETKQYDLDFIYCAGRDDKRLCHFGIMWKDNRHVYALKSVSGLAVGSDQMSDVDKSELGLKLLLKFLESPATSVACMLSNRKRVFNADGAGSTKVSSAPKNLTPADEDFF